MVLKIIDNIHTSTHETTGEDGIAKKIDRLQNVVRHIRVQSLASTGINFDQDLREKIKLYRSIHDTLCDVCELVNDIFSIQLLLISASLFSDVTFCFYRANRTGSLLPAMVYHTQDQVVEQEIELFMMQLLHRKVTFTAFDFLPIDCTLLYSASTGVNFDQDIREKSKLYRSIHDTLCDICQLVNEIFAIQLLLISAGLFSDVTFCLYGVFQEIFAYYHGWSFISSLCWVVMVFVVSRTSVEANRTGSLIHAIRCTIHDSVVDNEIEIFMMQLLHRKVIFTAFDFLSIDCTLINSANRTGSLMQAMKCSSQNSVVDYEFVGAVTTYLFVGAVTTYLIMEKNRNRDMNRNPRNNILKNRNWNQRNKKKDVPASLAKCQTRDSRNVMDC
uniref:Gustatory receptor n=1 Tax=Timema cristinae TaxID=61476 RepID=A0A7R9CNB3_TIMCR|nr:unnamed protein product [Timema cristinae]